jgi:hypothetical protein
MPQTKPKLTALEVRKQMLLLESDLNREQLIEAIEKWKEEFHHSKEQLTKVSSLASTAAKAFATFSSIRRLFSGRSSSGKKSWLSYIFDGVSTGTSLWSLFHSHRKKEDENEQGESSK